MALVTSCAVLLAVGFFAIIATGLGHRLLRFFALKFPRAAEQLLYSAAVGVICFEILLFLAQMTGHVRLAVVLILFASLLFGIPDFPLMFSEMGGIGRRVLLGQRSDKLLITMIGIVLLIEGLAAMAPVTGSDALHYHFTAPLLVLRSGFQPYFFLSHSFLCGQSHLLVLAGLALRSDQLAMGLLFLGGVLAAAASACFMRIWTECKWSWVVALVFLVTPVVFWQISSAGAPDLWMAFFTTMGVLAISGCKHTPHVAGAVLTGALAGATAGTKYTGCMVAAAMALAYILETRSAAKFIAFLLGALTAGIWPYARNFAWTGDPFFPFMTRWLVPSKVNAYTLAALLADTGANERRHILQVIAFPFFSAFDPAHLGFWQFMGPLVIAFVPLLILVVRNTPAWRATLIVWFGSAILIGWSSGMTRFLLPILPIALAAVLAGVSELWSTPWPAARVTAVATLFGFVLFAIAGLLVYERAALSAVIGLTSKEEYLRAHAPEYQKVEFINDVLAGRQAQGKALVFLRHLYYLKVPFVYGDPAASWAIDPARLQTVEEWRQMFRDNGIRWIVRSGNYPESIEAPLREMEVHGQVHAVATREVSDFRGLRLAGERQLQSITLLEVAP
jgi:Protein of unknown function (DUF1420)